MQELRQFDRRTFLKASGSAVAASGTLVTGASGRSPDSAPADLAAGAATTCSGSAATDTVGDSLSGPDDYDCWSYSWEFPTTCEVVLEVTTASDVDFDLYLATGQTTCPVNSYDYASRSATDHEQIVIEDPDTSTPLQICVDSYSGSGEYTLTITEYGE